MYALHNIPGLVHIWPPNTKILWEILGKWMHLINSDKEHTNELSKHINNYQNL